MKRRTLHAIALAVLVVLIGWMPSAIADDTPQPSAENVQKWVVDRMVAWAKPGITLLPVAMETFDDGKARYGLIANAAMRAVVKNKSMFGGSKGRIRTAALILAIAMFESSFRKDVDMNLGQEGRGDGGRSWCLMQLQLGSPIYIDETGRRVILTQVCKRVPAPGGDGTVNKCEYVPPPGAKASTPSRIVFVGDGYELTSDQTRGYSGQDLVSNRELCFAAGLRIVRNSFNACSKLPTLERLSAYASGNCDDGREASRKRVGAAIRWIAQYPPPMNDEQLVALFSTPAETDSIPAATMHQGRPALSIPFGPGPAGPNSANLALQP
jgi:hypothetical protein